MATFGDDLFGIHRGGEGSDIQQWQLLLPAGILQVIGLHERQAVAIEYKADVDKEHAVAGAAVEEFLFQQFADTTLIGPVADVVVLGNVLIELNFIRARIGPHFVVDDYKDLDTALRQPRRLLDAVEEHLDEAGSIDFLFPPEAHAADAPDFTGAVVHYDGTFATGNVDPLCPCRQAVRLWNAGIRAINRESPLRGDLVLGNLNYLALKRHFHAPILSLNRQEYGAGTTKAQAHFDGSPTDLGG